MKRLIAFTLAFSAVIFIGLSACTKKTTAYPKQARGVLAAFLQADSQAVALSEKTWPTLAAYTTWTAMPPWDALVIIDGYDVGETREGSTRAQVDVTYHTRGRLGKTYVADARRENVVFHLNKIDDQWKVDLPQLPPHVSWETMQKRLAQGSVENPQVKASNDALIAQIAGDGK